MKLAEMTWPDVDRALTAGCAVLLPTGSTEQHGPIGRIGTDTLCAEAVALDAAARCGGIVAPALAYTPAPFNTGFAGTVSLSEETFAALAREVIQGLLAQGFTGVFVVNGHGANLAPLAGVQAQVPPGRMQVMSWWEPEPVQDLRKTLYGAWEGMHATPSEVSITEHLLGALPHEPAAHPPEALSAEYIAAHAGDRHGPPDAHRAQFPDGRVGSHSALAHPDHGDALLTAAGDGIGAAFVAFQREAGAL